MKRGVDVMDLQTAEVMDVWSTGQCWQGMFQRIHDRCKARI